MSPLSQSRKNATRYQFVIRRGPHWKRSIKTFSSHRCLHWASDMTTRRANSSTRNANASIHAAPQMRWECTHAFSKDESYPKQKNLSVSSTHTLKPSGYCGCIFTVARQWTLSDSEHAVVRRQTEGCCQSHSTPDYTHDVPGSNLAARIAILLYPNPSRHNRLLPHPQRHAVS